MPACAPEQAPPGTTPISSSATTITVPSGVPAASPFPVPSGYPLDGADPHAAYIERRNGEWIVGTGVVERILRDDTKAPRHQRFILRISNAQSILVAHNVDLAPRVPLKKGDRIGFRGEYIWNEQGGVLHDTHRKGRGRDPEGGGWLVRNEQGYR